MKQHFFRLTILALLSSSSLWADPVSAARVDDDLSTLLQTLLEQSSRSDVPFRDVVRTVTGHRVLPLQKDLEVDRAVFDAVSGGIAHTILLLNEPDSPTNEEKRINEVSRHFEVALESYLNALPNFSCGKPKTQTGTVQSSGYPDLRIVHEPSGRVTYLDPKLVAEDSLKSTFRTFYYTPRVSTNKILESAHHLLLGIQHNKQLGSWTFTGWKLVDLHGFHVRLKAEYQGSNRDLYREGL
ncbi:MAG: hypothetical protein AAF191_18610, partial [Verrucomicrobiota bacterium]